MQRIFFVAWIIWNLLGPVWGQEGSRTVPLPRAGVDDWMLEVDNGNLIRHADMQRHRRYFIRPVPLERDRPPADWKPGQFFAAWEMKQAEPVILRFYFVSAGFEGPPAPGMVESAEKTLIREFQLSPGDQVYLTELKKMGYHPVRMRLVAAGDDSMPFPSVRIDVHSLQIVDIARIRNRIDLTLANHSNRPVLSLHRQADHCPGGSRSFPPRPLIPAGGEKTLRCHLRPDPFGKPDPGRIVVTSVLFDDFSYQGDANPAREALASFTGAHHALPLVLAEIRASIEEPRQEDVVPLLQDLLNRLASIEIALPDESAREFSALAGDGRPDLWRQRLRMGALGVIRMVGKEMDWNTRRSIERGASPDVFWKLLERQEERLSKRLEFFEANPPGPLF